MELLALLIGFIIAVIVSRYFGGNIITFIFIWGVGMFVSAIILSVMGLVLGVLAKWIIIILVIVLLISLINRLRGKAT